MHLNCTIMVQLRAFRDLKRPADRGCNVPGGAKTWLQIGENGGLCR